ncbi:response regulator transcription factor [Amedibacillus sp. YH-ame10]
MIKVMIADDQELMRDSLSILLRSKEDIEITGFAKDGNEVMELLKSCRPDVILMDIRMPGMDGTLCTKYVKEKYPEIKVIILTTFDDDEYIYDALKNGASSYLLKGVSLNELYTAIHTVYEGGGVIHPDVAIKAMHMFSSLANQQLETPSQELPIHHLSKTEWRIIEKVGNGLSNKEIAEELSFTEGTIRNYLSIILDKLTLRDRTQLAIWAVQNPKVILRGME